MTTPADHGPTPFRALPRWQQALIVLGALAALLAGAWLTLMRGVTLVQVLATLGVALLSGLAVLGVFVSQRPGRRWLGTSLLGGVVVGGLAGLGAVVVLQLHALQQRSYPVTITNDTAATVLVYERCADYPRFSVWLFTQLGIMEQREHGHYCRWPAQGARQATAAPPGGLLSPFGNARTRQYELITEDGVVLGCLRTHGAEPKAVPLRVSGATLALCAG